MYATRVVLQVCLQKSMHVRFPAPPSCSTLNFYNLSSQTRILTLIASSNIPRTKVILRDHKAWKIGHKHYPYGDLKWHVKYTSRKNRLIINQLSRVQYGSTDCSVDTNSLPYTLEEEEDRKESNLYKETVRAGYINFFGPSSTPNRVGWTSNNLSDQTQQPFIWHQFYVFNNIWTTC